MADKTKIAWTDHTFNIAWGCTKVSPGCKNCYADSQASRFGHNVWGPNKPRRTFGEKHWAEPLQWEKAAAKEGKAKRVFCSSMCDVFEDHATIDAEREKLWPLIAQTPHLHWQLLTKRPERIAANLPADWDAIKSRVWIGTSVENADYVGRVDHIRGIDAAVRFVSYEPALGPIAHAVNLVNIDWLIYGGESGANFRPEDKQ
jgi:protein gp37